MKVLVIGASRGIGLETVKAALERGHEVTALARDTTQLPLDHPQLRKVNGDAREPADIKAAVEGQDAVLFCVGVNPTTKPVDVFSRGTRNVLEAMASEMKFICITGIGAGDSRGHGGFLYDKIFQPLLLKTIYEDKDRQEDIIKASGAEWLIVRPAFLTNGPRTGKYRAVTDLTGVTAGKISRADVADFMLNQLETPTMFRQAVLLMY